MLQAHECLVHALAMVGHLVHCGLPNLLGLTLKEELEDHLEITGQLRPCSQNDRDILIIRQLEELIQASTRISSVRG